MRPGNGSSGSSTSARAAAPSPAMAAAMSGAVDLAAVKARSEAAARAAAAPPPTAASDFVIDVTEADFQAKVLDRSFQVPVLLDLWADWCEPCKQLSPVLEKLAREAAGTWVLAKIDIEANQRIAQMLQVQSIPTVFAVLGGQLVPGFQGALPEAQVREFIGALLQAAEQAGLTGPGGVAPDASAESGDSEPAAPAEPEDERFTAAEQALQDGDFVLATQRYEAILLSEPANQDAQYALRQVGLMKRLSELPADALDAASAAPDDVDAQLAAADFELANNLIDAAFARLIGLLKRLPADERGPVRDRVVEYFDLLGPDDPRVAPARRDLANALF